MEFLITASDLMKTMFALLCFLTLLSQSRAMDDQQISALLVGHWRAVGGPVQVNGTTVSWVREFNLYANGRWDGRVGCASANGLGTGTFSGIGRWQVQNGIYSSQAERVDPWLPGSNAASLFNGSGRVEFIDRDTFRFEGADWAYRRQ